MSTTVLIEGVPHIYPSVPSPAPYNTVDELVDAVKEAGVDVISDLENLLVVDANSTILIRREVWDGTTSVVSYRNMAGVVVVPTQPVVPYTAPGLATAVNQATANTLLTDMSNKLPASIGQKAAASSMSVVLASNQTLPLPTGAATESTLAAASAKLPASLGQKAASASMSVVMATDQSPRATVTATIANGASVSGVVDLLNTALLGFIAPAAWTAAALNIEVSMDNTSWVTTGLYDSSSTQAGNYPSLVAGAAYAVDTLTLLPFRYVRLRSGTAASAVNQGAQRDFTLITRPLA